MLGFGGKSVFGGAGRALALAGLGLGLGGCALPLQVQVASWLIDGSTMAKTGKSITDHGISLAVNKDCSIWRFLVGGALCSDYPVGGVAVADAGGRGADPAPPGIRARDVMVAGLAGPAPRLPRELSELRHPLAVSGYVPKWGSMDDSPSARVMRADRVLGPVRAGPPARAQTMAVRWIAVAKKGPRRYSPASADGLGAWEKRAWEKRAWEKRGRVFVLGNFAGRAAAIKAAASHPGLDLRMVTRARARGGRDFLLTTQAFPIAAKPAVRRRLAAAGVFGAWSMRLDDDDLLSGLADKRPPRPAAPRAAAGFR